MSKFCTKKSKIEKKIKWEAKLKELEDYVIHIEKVLKEKKDNDTFGALAHAKKDVEDFKNNKNQ